MTEFVPKDLTNAENVNIPKVSQGKEFLILLGAMVAIVVSIYFVSGVLLHLVIDRIPTKVEDSLVSIIDLSKFETAEKYKDEQEYIQNLVNELAQLDPRVSDRKFTVRIMEEDEANALAFPGGNIVVTSGLLKQIESENELAMIMGHELGHYAYRDHLRGMGRGLLVAVLSVAVLGANSDLAGLLGSTMTSIDLKYSREQELAADRFGLDMLNSHYLHVGGATDFFERVKDKEVLPEFLNFMSTHPVSEQRISAIEKRIEENLYDQEDNKPLSFDLEK